MLVNFNIIFIFTSQITLQIDIIDNKTTIRNFLNFAVSGGWPQPEDLKTAFVHADRGALDPPTTHVWCWTHARDYATFAAFYAPPPWCAAAWRALGFGSAEGVFSS